MKETMIKKQTPLLLLVAFLATGEAYGSIQQLQNALQTNNRALALEIYNGNQAYFDARPGQKQVIANRFPGIFDVVRTVVTPGGGGGPVAGPTESLIDIGDAMRAAIKIGDAQDVADTFNKFSDRGLTGTQLATLGTFESIIKSAFPTLQLVTTLKGYKNFVLAGSIPAAPPLPGGPGGTFGPPPPPPPPPSLFGALAGKGGSSKKGTVIETIDALEKELKNLQAECLQALSGDIENKTRENIQKNMTNALKTRVKNCLVNIKKINTTHPSGVDQNAFATILDKNIAHITDLTMPPTLFDKNTKNIAIIDFITQDTNCAELSSVLIPWADAFIALDPDPAKRKSAEELKAEILTFIKAFTKLKQSYADFAFIFDVTSKSPAVQSKLAAAYPAFMGNHTALIAAQNLATQACADAITAMNNEFTRLDSVTPRMADADIEAALALFEKPLVGTGSALQAAFLAFSNLVSKYTSPTDQVCQHLLDVLNKTPLAPVTGAPSGAPIDPDTIPPYDDPALRTGMIYQGLRQKYLTAFTKWNAAQGIVTAPAVSALALASAGASKRLETKMIEKNITQVFNSCADYFEAFLANYAAATVPIVAPVTPITPCSILAPIKDQWTSKDMEKIETHVVGQNLTTGEFPTAPNDAVLIYDREDSPFIVSLKIQPTRPLVAVEPEGLVEIPGLTLEIGFLKEGYEIAPAAGTVRKLGNYDRYKVDPSAKAALTPKANNTFGYDLYCWAPEVIELPPTTVNNISYNLHRIYTTEARYSKGNSKEFRGTLRFNDNCLQARPDNKKKTRLYKMYSYDAGKILGRISRTNFNANPGIGPDGTTRHYGRLEVAAHGTALNYIEQTYNKMMDKLQATIQRVTPTL